MLYLTFSAANFGAPLAVARLGKYSSLCLCAAVEPAPLLVQPERIMQLTVLSLLLRSAAHTV